MAEHHSSTNCTFNAVFLSNWQQFNFLPLEKAETYIWSTTLGQFAQLLQCFTDANLT